MPVSIERAPQIGEYVCRGSEHNMTSSLAFGCKNQPVTLLVTEDTLMTIFCRIWSLVDRNDFKLLVSCAHRCQEQRMQSLITLTVLSRGADINNKYFTHAAHRSEKKN